MPKKPPIVRKRPRTSESRVRADALSSQDSYVPDSWEGSAEWYDDHLREADTHHQQVIGPGVGQMLEGFKMGTVLDLACGTGFMCRLLAARRWKPTGVDLSEEMLQRARKQGPATIDYVEDDAETLDRVTGDFDAAVSVMAVQNMKQPERMLRAATSKLRPGAPLLIVTLHPAFRIPRWSDWGWDPDRYIAYRRIDRYLSRLEIPIQMHPGSAPRIRTMTYHRPIQFYVNSLAAAGLAVDRMEEWCSHRVSTSGPRAEAENAARNEIPLFLALRAVKPRG